METTRFSSSRPVIGNEPENSLLSFEEVEDRIHQLVGENTCLRSNDILVYAEMEILLLKT